VCADAAERLLFVLVALSRVSRPAAGRPESLALTPAVVKPGARDNGVGPVDRQAGRAAFIMAALVASVPLRDVQLAARHADPRTTTVYDRRCQNFDRHAAYAVVAFVTSG
jgi:integrase/recombinase XerD